MATGTVYGNWAEFPINDGKAERKIRTYYTWTTSETKTSFSIAVKVYIQMNAGATINAHTVTLSGTGYSNSTASQGWKYSSSNPTLLYNVINKTFSYTKGTAAKSVTITSTSLGTSGVSKGKKSTATRSFTVPALAKVTISFNANGGDGTVSNISTYYGVSTKLPSDGYERTGYVLKGFNTKADGTGTNYALGGNISVTANTTLYAVWQTTYVAPKIENVVAYRVNAATGGVDPEIESGGTRGFCRFTVVGGANFTITSGAVSFGNNDPVPATAVTTPEGERKVYAYSGRGIVLDRELQYDVNVTLTVTGTDGIGRTYTSSTYISKVTNVLGISNDHNHVAFFDMPEEGSTEKKLTINGIDYAMTADEYDALETLLGGVTPKLMDWIYPIGSVIANTDTSFNPNEIYRHQKWERFAGGRVLVGYAASDSYANQMLKTGGESTHKLTVAEMPAHHHSMKYRDVYGGGGGYGANMPYGHAASTQHANTNEVGENAYHNNLQPYIVVQYWRRIA